MDLWPLAVINPRSSKKVFLESVRVYESRSIRESSLGTLFLTRLKVLELAKLTIDAYGFSMVA